MAADPSSPPQPGDGGAGLWLDDERSAAPASGPGRGRRAAALLGLVAVLAAVAVPVGWALASGHGASTHTAESTSTTGRTATTLGHGPAEQHVLAALSATTDSGNFDVSYTLAGHPGPATTPSTQCQQVPVMAPGDRVVIGGGGADISSGPMVTGTVPTGRPEPAGGPASGPPSTVATHRQCFTVQNDDSTTVTGSGTIDVSPKAMVVAAHINVGLDVSVRLDDEKVWESGGADYGINPTGGSSGGVVSGDGQSLSGFASLVESTLGQRVGPVAMIGMASPAGYLDLEQESVTGAAQVGTGTVDGTPVTLYEVSVDPSRLETMPGLSADEVATIQAAVGVLHSQGYTGTTVKVAIDGAGFIRQATSTAAFADGGSVVLDGTFSHFGCAGVVTMPGQPPSPSTTQPCASDVPTTSTTATTVTPASVAPDLSSTTTTSSAAAGPSTTATLGGGRPTTTQGSGPTSGPGPGG